MPHNRFLLSILSLLVVFNVACKKELKKVMGKYNGTARYVFVDLQNPSLNKDTLYTNVSLEVKEGAESSKKQLTIGVANSVANTQYDDDIYINDGAVNYTRTNRGEVNVYYTWKGEIKSDSLKLSYKRQHEYYGYYEWTFRAKK